jgi:hypothetical protein
VHRSDEVGVLQAEFFNVVCVLHNRLLEKKAKPKFPENPFHCEPMVAQSAESSEEAFNWNDFNHQMTIKLLGENADPLAALESISPAPDVSDVQDASPTHDGMLERFRPIIQYYLRSHCAKRRCKTSFIFIDVSSCSCYQMQILTF